GFDVQLNALAGQMQVLDLLSEGRLSRRAAAGAAPPSEGISVTYRLEGRTSLPSRSDHQLIQIAALSLSGEFYKVATPLLTSYVYNEANVVNDGSMVLLAGAYSAYLDGEFVGR